MLGTPSWSSAGETPASLLNVASATRKPLIRQLHSFFAKTRPQTTGRCGDSHQSQMCTGAVMFFPRIAAGSSPPVTNALTRTPPSKNVYLPCQRTKLR